ncbi:hypothetical protein EHI8A_021430 [Entamoeba histolytica HM-1:IMSS-B]|nr:Hypothetical protein EHI5A_021630 [Entamoeba histolytica KU27]EMH74147.1 hypothetical protein EHI8A_021430 [Entamoeba histolytica HM-1:IMSS-B]EMS11177.1 hypothetical protein KM1_028180 [Entamoeba histolytica HM-3:IMSS]BAN38211.1 hypothetical protein [Entamoeba histolytica]BAN39864.1 hypothetical protein [Entamoeba histolytica]
MFKKMTSKLNDGLKNVSNDLKGKPKDVVCEQIEKDKKDLLALSAKIKKAQEKFEKLGKDAKEQYDEHKKALKLCADVVTCDPNPFNESIKIIEENDEKAKKYEEKLQKKVMKPLKMYLEAVTVLEKRVKILDERGKAMEKAEHAYHDMLKKPENKQVGLSDLKVNYTNARDSWEYLRDELSVDIKKVLDEITSNFGQICSGFMKTYSKYMKNTQEVWDKLHDYAKEIKVGDLDKEPVYTATEQSMVGEPNVQARREKEIANGTYVKVE